MKNFAVAGVGRMGSFIAEELLKLKTTGAASKISILTRTNSSSKDTLERLAGLGAQITPVDYDSHATLVSALTGIDAVISCIGDYVSDAQHRLADAAKEAGVKLFLPAEYGLYSKGVNEGFYVYQNKIHRKLEDIDLSYALIYNGMWSDGIFVPPFGWDVRAGKVRIVGDGSTPISWTTRRDVGRFVAHILTSVPPEQLYWKTISIEGDRKSLNELVEEYKTRTGKTLEVTYTPVSEQEKIVKESSPFEFKGILAWLLLAWDRGATDLSRSPGGLSNDMWAEWNPKPAIDALLEKYP